MRNSCIYNFLERLLCLDLLIKHPERNILKIDYISLLAIKHDLLLNDTEHELLLILLRLILVKVNVLFRSLYRAIVVIFHNVFSNVAFFDVIVLLGVD